MLQEISRFLTKDIPVYWRSSGKRPALEQIRGMIRLGRAYKYIPYHYIKYGLYLETSHADELAYLPPQLVARYRDSVNPVEARHPAINKDEFKEVLGSAGVPIIPTLFVLTRNDGITDPQGNPVTYDLFETTLQSHSAKSFFLKPCRGGSGSGIQRVLSDDTELSLNDKPLSEAWLYETIFSSGKYQKVLVEPAFRQHDLLNSIYPGAVNTIRIDTLMQDDVCKTSFAFLRVAIEGYMDNLSQNGLVVPVDLETGVLGDLACTKMQHGQDKTPVHPTTGFRFAGQQIPFWQEIRSMVEKAARAMLPLSSLGWDVAIGTEGPAIIETNQDFAVFSTQVNARGLRDTPLGQATLNAR